MGSRHILDECGPRPTPASLIEIENRLSSCSTSTFGAEKGIDVTTVALLTGDGLQAVAGMPLNSTLDLRL